MAAIPDKRYFKIGEVCQLAEVKPHVLRYWEAEFTVIRPQRGSSKQRLYRRADVENILHIRDLLYSEGFTIAGAKKALAEQKKKVLEAQKAAPKKPVGVGDPKFVKGIKTELQALKKLLES
jgi:DNA-binding transcriptional MerR regulator